MTDTTQLNREQATAGRRIETLRTNYDPSEVAAEDAVLRSPRSGHVLFDPRPVGAGQRPDTFDRHPAGYDRETLLWDRPLDERVRFDVLNGRPRAMLVQNVVCLLPGETWGDNTAVESNEAMSQQSGESASQEKNVIAGEEK